MRDTSKPDNEEVKEQIPDAKKFFNNMNINNQGNHY